MLVLGLVVSLVLLVPLLAIFLDSEVGRALAHRLEPRPPQGGEIERRLQALEEEVEYLSEAIRSMQAQVRRPDDEPGAQ
ncbi:MAG: hypothetical protein JSU87_16835 [Gemmatimonadota bacterium]|nr:MAG: hypothetical protein JSU87_16835 [Gemmatimonadota bacterium]